MTHALRYMPDSPPPDDIVERNRRLARKWDAAWEDARRRYLAGETAKDVCRRHGIALSTFRYRANVEGWRRCDAEAPAAEPAPPPEPHEAPSTPSSSPCSVIPGLDPGTRGPIASDPADRAPSDDPERMDARDKPGHDGAGATADHDDDPDPAYAVLLGDARRHMARAVRDGRPLEAQRWLRVMRDLTVLAEEEAQDEIEEARDAGVLVDLTGPRPFQTLSDPDLLFAMRALRRALDLRLAQKQAAEKARQSAADLDSVSAKSLDSAPTPSSPPCSSRGPISSDLSDQAQPDDPAPMDARNTSGHDGGEGADTILNPDAAPPLSDERDEINGFYRSRPT